MDAHWPLSSHMPAPSCTPSGSPFCQASPRAPWPSNSWAWTWACGRRSWTRWAWAPGGHTAPGKPSACPYRWTPGRSCRRGRGPGWRHRLEPLLCFHPPWSTLTGLPGPHAAPPPPTPVSGVPGVQRQSWNTLRQDAGWRGGGLTPSLGHVGSEKQTSGFQWDRKFKLGVKFRSWCLRWDGDASNQSGN